jgi:hypothetical protein
VPLDLVCRLYFQHPEVNRVRDARNPLICSALPSILAVVSVCILAYTAVMATKTVRPRVFYPLRLDADDLASLKRIEDEIGIPRAEQCRRAIKAWLLHNDIQRPPRLTAARKTAKRKA